VGLQLLPPQSIPIAKLESVLGTLRTKSRRRLAQTKAVKVAYHSDTFTGQVGNISYANMPMCSIWDALGTIYGGAIEPVTSDRVAELHVLQLRMIVRCARNIGYWGTECIPSTVAVSWFRDATRPFFPTAFGFSCLQGPDNEWCEVQHQLRQSYMGALHRPTDEAERRRWGTGNNVAGNCPEYLTLPTICKSPGSFGSLCLSVPRGHLMQCCFGCRKVIVVAEESGMYIEDRWTTSSLIDPAKITITEVKGARHTRSEYPRRYL